MADLTWSCEWAADAVEFVRSELSRRGLIFPWSVPPVQKCIGCKKKRKYCKGWVVDMNPPNSLQFVPVEVRGKTLRVSLSGFFDFRRDVAPKTEAEWFENPARALSVALSVEGEDEGLLTRQHVDLANRGQHGPVWHFQLGGVPGRAAAGGVRLDLPRWPAWPTDFLLAVEAVLFNFFWEKWTELRSGGTWPELVRQAEDLLWPHYHLRYQDYSAQRERIDSWLAAQCNQSGSWNPRS